jgi:hypothetical protein
MKSGDRNVCLWKKQLKKCGKYNDSYHSLSKDGIIPRGYEWSRLVHQGIGLDKKRIIRGCPRTQNGIKNQSFFIFKLLLRYIGWNMKRFFITRNEL